MGFKLPWVVSRDGTLAQVTVGGFGLTAATHGPGMPGWWRIAGRAQGDSDGEPTTLLAVQEAAEAAAARLLAEDAGVRALMGADALHAELARISTEMGMPPGVGPADGELARLMKDGNALRAELEKRREDVRLLRESLADVRERMALERVVAVESVRRELANALAMLNEWRQLVEDARQDKADLRARVVTLEAALRWIPVTERLPDEGARVLVACEGDTDEPYIMTLRRSAVMDGGYYWEDDAGAGGAVLHPSDRWRPLPPGPEVGQ